MKENCFNEQAKTLLQECGNYVVIINTISPESVNDIEKKCGTIVFTEDKSLDNAVAIGLGLKHVLPADSLVYVVHRDCLSTYTTSYTCLFDF